MQPKMLSAVTLVLTSAIFAATASAQAQPLDLSTSLTAGTRAGVSMFRWDLSHSRLELRGLRTAHFQGAVVAGVAVFERWRLRLRGSGRYGTVVAGAFQDSDFSSQGTEVSRSIAEVTEGEIRRGVVALGVERTVSRRWLESISLWRGVARDHKMFRLQNGRQIIPKDEGLDRRLAYLDSRYQARWAKRFWAATATIPAGEGTVETRVAAFHRARFYGEGEWNLRPDLMQPRSFSQGGRGKGYHVAIRYARGLPIGLELVAEAAYRRMWLKSGRDTLHVYTGDPYSSNIDELVDGGAHFAVLLSTPL